MLYTARQDREIITRFLIIATYGFTESASRPPSLAKMELIGSMAKSARKFAASKAHHMGGKKHFNLVDFGLGLEGPSGKPRIWREVG